MVTGYYFQSYGNYFWQWEDNLEVVTIPNGRTIAYSALILDILNKISEQGFPPFGSLLLTIIATNPNGKEMIEEAFNKLNEKYLLFEETIRAKRVLNILADLPRNYKEGTNRLLVFQTIFKDCHNVNAANHSNRILNSYTFGKQKPEIFDFNSQLSYHVFSKDFNTIALLDKQYQSVEQIMNKIASLPEFVEEIKIYDNEQINETSADLIDQLIDNEKTFYVGSLIKRIWSGLNIPVHSTLPSQQPLGGFSDLTNKGDFDKLLISEFANDDLVFLSRLANNEALYIQREIPPVNSNLKRIILIDISLKNWGTPKSIAFAILLAIAKHPKTNIECSAYVVGASYQAISIDNIHEIIRSLQFLDGILDASLGLEAFFKDYNKNKNCEIFIITEPSTLKRPDMLRLANDYKDFINYWIYTDVEGNIDVYKKQQNSKKHIQHIQLPLNELWSKSKGKIELQERNTETPQYPLLFRSSMSSIKILNTSDGEIFKVTGEKTLFRFYEKTAALHEKGWELLYENLPFTPSNVEIGTLKNGNYIILMYNQGDRKGFILNINTGVRHDFVFTEWKSYHSHSFIFYGYAFYHTNSKGTWLINEKGKIEKVDVSHLPIFREREEELTLLANKYRYAQNVFKNIHSIMINELGNLVFNTHELRLNKGNHLKLDTTTFLSQKYMAKQISYTEFEFNEGSRIEINRNGLLILKSSNKDIPTIFIPSVLDASLGVATDTLFAGNPYYLKQPLYKVVLVNAGANKLTVVKELKIATGRGLKEARDLIYNTPCTVYQFISESRAFSLRDSLANCGAVLKVERINEVYFKTISTKQFFDEIIGTFIQNISDSSFEKPKNDTFSIIETNPEYPGGQAAMFKYLSENIRYPVITREKGIEGQVVVGFVVDTDGGIVDVNIKKGLHPLLDEEAMRVVKNMKPWKPGTQQGRRVRVAYSLPIKFKLD